MIIGTGNTNNPVPPSFVQYSGLAPGLVGVWQVNVKIPDEVAPTTNAVPTPVVFQVTASIATVTPTPGCYDDVGEVAGDYDA